MGGHHARQHTRRQKRPTHLPTHLPGGAAHLRGPLAREHAAKHVSSTTLQPPSSPSVLWFSNKPLRHAGALPLTAWAATPDGRPSPFASVWATGPNGALVGTTPTGARATLALALGEPTHDAAAGTLTFNASALAPPLIEGGDEHEQEASATPSYLLLSSPSLFIDQFSAGFGAVPLGPGYSGTSCLLPSGCLSAVVCGWCPSRFGGGGGFGGGGFGWG